MKKVLFFILMVLIAGFGGAFITYLTNNQTLSFLFGFLIGYIGYIVYHEIFD